MSISNLVNIEKHQDRNWLPAKRYLRAYRQSEMDELFVSLPNASAADLRGNYVGKVYAIKGVDRLPKMLRILVTLIAQLPLPVWIGKNFNDTSGANLWVLRQRPLKFGYYKVAADEASQMLYLDYNIEANPTILKPVMGEVKFAGNDTYLARMLYRGKNQTLCVLYFTLSLIK